MIVHFGEYLPFTLLFTVNGSIISQIAWKVLFAFSLGVVVCSFWHYDYYTSYKFSVFTPMGVAISLFLGFRNNACYARWWEGRKQWGRQVIEVRNLARILETLVPGHPLMANIVNLSIAHCHAMRHQLRQDENAPYELDRYLTAAELQAVTATPNPADAILTLANQRLRMLREQEPEKMDSYSMLGVHNHIAMLCGVQGACERIKHTPVPFPYVLLVHRTVWMYILIIPFALIEDVGYLTPFVMAIVAYVFFGLDELAQQLESPFSTSQHALCLEAMCRTNEISAAMALGYDVFPEPSKATNMCLM